MPEVPYFPFLDNITRVDTRIARMQHSLQRLMRPLSDNRARPTAPDSGHQQCRDRVAISTEISEANARLFRER